MSKWVLGAMCAVLVVAAPKGATAIQDVKTLFEYATSGKEVEKTIYGAYVSGIAHGFSAALEVYDLTPLYCVGDPYDITNGDIADAFRLWMKKMQQELDAHHPALAVALALKEHFPCKAKKP